MKLAADKKPREALAAYEAALEYPENLEVGRVRNSSRTAQIQFLIGTAHEARGDAASARAAFEQAVRDAASAKAASERTLAGRGDSDYKSDYFSARALQKLGRTDEAKPIFDSLVKIGQEQLAKGEGPDYFAKFGEKTSERVRQANAHYLIGLGQLGLGEEKKAGASFRQALELHPAHLGAREQSHASVAR
jgi:tetratricopeptide (TPR) repeat protein